MNPNFYMNDNFLYFLSTEWKSRIAWLPENIVFRSGNRQQSSKNNYWSHKIIKCTQACFRGLILPNISNVIKLAYLCQRIETVVKLHMYI